MPGPTGTTEAATPSIKTEEVWAAAPAAPHVTRCEHHNTLRQMLLVKDFSLLVPARVHAPSITTVPMLYLPVLSQQAQPPKLVSEFDSGAPTGQARARPALVSAACNGC